MNNNCVKNNNLKIYCAMLVIVIICSVVRNAIHFDVHHSTRSAGGGEYGLELADLPAEFAKTDSIEGGVRTTYLPTFDIEVYVRPQNMAGDKVLLSHADGHTFKVQMQKVKISVPMSQADFKTPQFILLAVSLCSLIPMVIWLLVITFRIIMRIRNGEIFAADVARYIEKLGALVIFFDFYMYLMAWLLSYYARQHFTLAQYDIVTGVGLETMPLILGLVLMIISQIILMGKELKEEQELTI